MRNAADELDDTFLVISGDVLTDIDLSAFVDGAPVDAARSRPIALKRVEDPLEFGIVITAPTARSSGSSRSRRWGQVFSDTINTGIYVLEPEVFDFIPEGEVVDFSSDVFPAILEQGPAAPRLRRRGLLGGRRHDSRRTSGRTQDILDGRVQVEIDGFRIGEGVWLGEGAEVDPEHGSTARSIIGDNCRIEAGAHVGEYTVLGTRRRREARRVRSSASVVPRPRLPRARRVGSGAASIGRSADLRSHARGRGGRVLGDECFVGEHAVVNPGVKVYPFKTVEAGAVVNSSIVWESRGRAHAVRPPRHRAASPTSTSPPRSRRGSRWRTARR